MVIIAPYQQVTTMANTHEGLDVCMTKSLYNLDEYLIAHTEALVWFVSVPDPLTPLTPNLGLFQTRFDTYLTAPDEGFDYSSTPSHLVELLGSPNASILPQAWALTFGINLAVRARERWNKQRYCTLTKM